MIIRDPDGTLYQESRYGSTRRLTRLAKEVVTPADLARAAERGRQWQADQAVMAHKAAAEAVEGRARLRQWRKAETKRADAAESTLWSLLHHGRK